MLRVLSVLILAFSVLARSSLAIEGEAHEASHLFVAGVEHASELHDATDDSEAPSLWHKLLHTDHCCGHSVAPVPSLACLRIASVVAEPTLAVGHHYRSRPPSTLYRPPIPA